MYFVSRQKQRHMLCGHHVTHASNHTSNPWQVGDTDTFAAAHLDALSVVSESAHAGDRALAIANFAFSQFLSDSANKRLVHQDDAAGEGWRWVSAQESLTALDV